MNTKKKAVKKAAPKKVASNKEEVSVVKVDWVLETKEIPALRSTTVEFPFERLVPKEEGGPNYVFIPKGTAGYSKINAELTRISSLPGSKRVFKTKTEYNQEGTEGKGVYLLSKVQTT